MAEISQIKAEDIMTGSPKSIAIDRGLNRAITIMNNENINYLVVYDKDKYTGIIGYIQLARLRRRPEEDAKIEDYITKPPLLSENANLLDIAEEMYRLNCKIMPVAEEGKITGVLTEWDVLKAILKAGLLGDKKLEEFMTPDPLTLYAKDTIGKAIVLLREHNVSRIPILNKENKVIRILESIDIVKKVLTDKKNIKDAGTATHPKYAGTISGISENITNSQIPVESLAKLTFVSAKKDDFLIDKVAENIEFGSSTIIVIDEDDYPIGIISPKDIIRFIAALKEKEKIGIQISGLESIKTLDEFQREEIYGIIKRRIEKISDISYIYNVTLHAKAYNEEGNRRKYVFRCKFTSQSGLIFARNWGWEPIDTISTLMNEVEKITLKKTEKFKDAQIKKRRDSKLE